MPHFYPPFFFSLDSLKGKPKAQGWHWAMSGQYPVVSVPGAAAGGAFCGVNNPHLSEHDQSILFYTGDVPQSHLWDTRGKNPHLDALPLILRSFVCTELCMCCAQLSWDLWINSIIQHYRIHVKQSLTFSFFSNNSWKNKATLSLTQSCLTICTNSRALDELHPNVLRIFAVNLCSAKIWSNLCSNSCSILHSLVLPPKQCTLY